MAVTLHASDFFVAPTGNDANPGTADRPFATLERARDAVRQLKQAGLLKEPVNIKLQGGTYRLAREVVFGPEDSGTAACPITYMDEGSTHLLVENNLVHHTKFAPYNIHFAKEVTVRNNIFALGKLEQVSRTRNEPHKSVFFENNIVYWREGELFSKNWEDVPYTFHFHPKDARGTATVTNTFDCDWNLYFNPELKLDQAKFGTNTWAEWQGRGKDVHSRYADPLFVAPEEGDFRLKPESPAFALGFQPFDVSQAGQRIKTGPQPY